MRTPLDSKTKQPIKLRSGKGREGRREGEREEVRERGSERDVEREVSRMQGGDVER